MQLPTETCMSNKGQLPPNFNHLPSHGHTHSDNNTSETYLGLTENDFKTRYRNHTSSFRHAHSRNSTELSKHIWDFKDNNIAHIISWNILARAKPFNSANKRCNLCLLEKFTIICQPERSTLNKLTRVLMPTQKQSAITLQQYPRDLFNHMLLLVNIPVIKVS